MSQRGPSNVLSVGIRMTYDQATRLLMGGHRPLDSNPSDSQRNLAETCSVSQNPRRTFSADLAFQKCGRGTAWIEEFLGLEFVTKLCIKVRLEEEEFGHAFTKWNRSVP